MRICPNRYKIMIVSLYAGASVLVIFLENMPLSLRPAGATVSAIDGAARAGRCDIRTVVAWCRGSG